mmetsp:Transcript_8945/g.26295  ORF Transcript_8945/g.26295 Transcript_8945/m.26295 type:complete len:432 (+) Transcript_8945:68-1363(+)|eukprot:CAMPEP_0168374120 /NCGR_PEP_ID=MMETSP0228-20121227/9139_1 /TAXON_ID=133427 /ORGANISM="Protoceratium reticulatum, Strain CCCM 535 (=CCMP 1889)" /LENGTH=431 /DNA_ID=CAMNT_0008387061 /DNA_START=56 /DNA_END=1351 /DNA_ORIENTATION=+
MSAEPTVFVKNTFLDLDDGPRMPDLLRWKSMPAGVGAGEYSDDESDDDKEADDTPGDPSSATAEPGAAEGQAPPPEMQDLYRTVTCDGYEPSNQWAWAGGDPNIGPFLGDPFMPSCAAPPPDPALDALGPVQPPMPPGPLAPIVGVVMMPSGAIPLGSMGSYAVPGPLPLHFGIPELPPDHVAVPVEPFTRWPGAVPAPPPEAPALTVANAGTAPEAGSPPAAPATAPAAPAPAPVPGPAPAAPAPAAAASSEPTAAPLPPLDEVALPAAPPRAPVLQRVFSIGSNIYRIRWTVDARRLKSTDREAVSPMFELSCTVPVQFKMVIRPKVVSNVRGGASFKKAKGKGAVELRCLDEVDTAMKPVVTFRFSVGSGNDTSKHEPPRGPVRHDFTTRAICGLPAGQDEWDFAKAVDEATQTFVVCLEISSGLPGA